MSALNSVFEEELNETVATQIVVVKGAVNISGEKRIGSLKKGQTISIAAEGILTLENACDGPALIVRVQMGPE